MRSAATIMLLSLILLVVLPVQVSAKFYLFENLASIFEGFISFWNGLGKIEQFVLGTMAFVPYIIYVKFIA